MSEPDSPVELEGTPEKVKPPHQNATLGRFKDLFTKKITLPGWLVILWGTFNYIPKWKSNFDFFVGTAKNVSPYFEFVSPIITSPYFGLALICAGIAYLAFVGQPEVRVVRHPAWTFFGWVLSLLIIIPALGTAAYGKFEIEINNLANQKIDAFFQTKLDTTQRNGSQASIPHIPTFVPGQTPHFTEQGLDYFTKLLHDNSPILSWKLMQPFIGMSLRYSGTISVMTENPPIITVGLTANTQIVICSFSSDYEARLAKLTIGSPVSGFGTITSIVGQALILNNCELD